MFISSTKAQKVAKVLKHLQKQVVVMMESQMI